MKIVEIKGDNYIGKIDRIRTACRAIIIKDNKQESNDIKPSTTENSIKKENKHENVTITTESKHENSWQEYHFYKI